MGAGKIIKLSASYNINLFNNLHMEILLDKDAEVLEEYDGRATICHVKAYDQLRDEHYERDLFFPLDAEIGSIEDLFKNEIALIAASWKKGCYFDWITDSNPETAWIFYKKTFDRVMSGEEIWKRSSLNAEIEWECSGNRIIYRHYPDGAERIFCGEKYIGRIVTKANSEKSYLNLDVPFICNINEQPEFPGAKYEEFFASKGYYLEKGIGIYHDGSLNGILDGILSGIEEISKSS